MSIFSIAGSTPSEGFELKSCRFDYASSAYLNRSLETATSKRIGTFSWWQKGMLENSGNDNGAVVSNYIDSSNRCYISFTGSLLQMYGK